MEYLKQKGLVGAARDAADEVLVRVGEAKAAVLHAPAVLLHKVRVVLACGPAARPGTQGCSLAAVPHAPVALPLELWAAQFRTVPGRLGWRMALRAG